MIITYFCKYIISSFCNFIMHVYPSRHLLYGKRLGVYRIIFDIQETSEEGPCVRVPRVWHSARDAITAEDIAAEY